MCDNVVTLSQLYVIMWMKHFLSLFAVLTSIFSVYGQIDSTNSIIDGTFILIPCEMDTTINFHSNVKLNWIDSLGDSSEYEFSEGDGTYIELLMHRQCKTRHGLSNQIILIDVSSIDSSQVLKLTSTNTTWLLRSSWMYDPFMPVYSGTLDLKNNTIEFDSRIDLERNVLVARKIIHHALLTKPNLH
ncbi:MAG: hypothetical protein ACI837_000522 [Crocinitomicaceae bacterium]|jgi:hypothetical protein